MRLLCLIRFVPIGRDHLAAWEACEFFMTALADAHGSTIHREDLQAMVLFEDAERGLALLSDTLEAGEKEGFAISAGLAQGIRSRATLASSLSGFTEGSMEALFEITAAAGPQEVAISTKLSSIVKLAAPAYASRFVPGIPQPGARIRTPLVMGPRRPAQRRTERAS